MNHEKITTSQQLSNYPPNIKLFDKDWIHKVEFKLLHKYGIKI